MKPEPPPYPRPVPSIDFEEDPLLPGTAVYTREEELDPVERVAKRRRIEANANAYLRGEGLFILSAGLRGPFDAGWRNPWVAKRNKRKADVDIDDRSPKKVHHSSNGRNRVQRVRTSIVSEQKHTEPLQQENVFERRIRLSEPLSHDEKVESWLRRNSALPRESFTTPTSPTPKKKSAAAGKGTDLKPTWTPTKQRIKISSQDINAPIHNPISRVVDSFDASLPLDQKPLKSAETHAKLQNALGVDEQAAGRDDYDGQRHKRARRSRTTTSSPVEPVRAEDAIFNLKRQPLEAPQAESMPTMTTGTVPLSMVGAVPRADAAVMRPPKKGIAGKQLATTSLTKENSVSATAEQGLLDEHGLGQGPQVRGEIKLKKLEASINDQLDEVQNHKDELHKEMEPSTATGASLLHFSTAISDVPSTKLPPSAQHKLELQTSTSNISSGALLPDAPTEMKPAPVPTNGDISTAAADYVENPKLHGSAQNQSIGRKTSIPTVPVQIIDRHNTEKQGSSGAGQDGYTPRPTFQTGSVTGEVFKSPTREPLPNARRSQTSLDGSFTKESSPVQQRNSRNKVKKASFGPDPVSFSSQGSIKSALRVQKLDTTEKLRRATPPPSFSKPGPNTHTSGVGQTSPKVSFSERSSRFDPLGEPIQRPKSILKAASTHSSAAAALATATLYPGGREPHSASNPRLLASGQRDIGPHQREEHFDMEGALDDLGSFLSTWDAEKEGLRVA